MGTSRHLVCAMTALTIGGERSFIMNTLGTARIHCTIHPQMVGTLVVQER